MNKLTTAIAVVSTFVATAAAPVFAAVPAEVTTAMDDAGTDVATIGGAALVVVIGIAVFRFMRRAV